MPFTSLPVYIYIYIYIYIVNSSIVILRERAVSPLELHRAVATSFPRVSDSERFVERDHLSVVKMEREGGGGEDGRRTEGGFSTRKSWKTTGGYDRIDELFHGWIPASGTSRCNPLVRFVNGWSTDGCVEEGEKF